MSDGAKLDGEERSTKKNRQRDSWGANDSLVRYQNQQPGNKKETQYDEIRLETLEKYPNQMILAQISGVN